MAKTMTLPKIGVNMTEVIVAEWLVKPGDFVNDGDAIFIGETDKAAQDILATDSGIIGKLLVEEGGKVKVNEPILVLLAEGEELQDEKTSTVQNPEPQNVPVTETQWNKESIVKKPVPMDKGRIRISPLAKKLADEYGIDIRILEPESEGKRIVKADVIAYKSKMETNARTIQSSQPAYDEGDVMDTIPMSNMRKVIARRMGESNTEKPSAALTVCARADEIIRLRNRYKERGIKVSFNDILVKITGKALTEHRIINSIMDGDNIKIMKNINVGVAIDTDKGLMVPVIKDADEKGLLEIASDFTGLVEMARDNKIDSEHLSGGTFTITNLGMYEIEQFTPIINPPECCILAVGAMKKEFVPDESDLPKLVTTMKLTLAFDHRIVDGAPAAKFLQSIKRYIEFPEMLM
ncbi:MAG: dihydrolipoamide acetyltransferase family protein [Clostridia bacterium]|nr:dihydrolipoamide acetyltransferase family protein [Clostridia bacterium]